jgi:A nuclease family of the HNH/ENDO VII superfamily with conserved AHH
LHPQDEVFGGDMFGSGGGGGGGGNYADFWANFVDNAPQNKKLNFGRNGRNGQYGYWHSERPEDWLTATVREEPVFVRTIIKWEYFDGGVSESKPEVKLKSTFWSWVQTGLDVLGSTEIPILSQIGDLASGVISLAQGDYKGALLSLGGAFIPGLSQAKLGRNILKNVDNGINFVKNTFQKHHLIPNQMWTKYGDELADLGWKQNHNKNLMSLPTPFHGNHPSYNNYMDSRVLGILNGNGNKLQDMINLQNEMRGKVGSILNSGYDKLNNYYKSNGF